MALEVEQATFARELPRLLAEGHKDRWAVISGSEVIGICATRYQALEMGYDKCGLGVFMLAEIRETPRVYRA